MALPFLHRSGRGRKAGTNIDMMNRTSGRRESAVSMNQLKMLGHEEKRERAHGGCLGSMRRRRT